MDIIHERVADLDVHKAMVVACVRVMADGKAERACRLYGTHDGWSQSLLAWLTETALLACRDGSDRSAGSRCGTF